MGISALAVANYNSADTTTYTGTPGTPVIGDLIIACFYVTGYTGVANCSGTFTWQLLSQVPANGGANTLYIFSAYASTATSTTPTLTIGSNATGCIISCVRLTGNEGQVQPYIRQVSTRNGSTANPSVVMTVAPLTGNGMIAVGCNLTNSSAQWAPPASWLEISETAGTIAPVCSLQIMYRLTGQTATTISWSNTNTTAWTTFAAEFYVAGTGPIAITGNGETGFFGQARNY